MKILITGASGFIGKNLSADINFTTKHEIFEFTRSTDNKLFSKYCSNADIVVHLAGINRPNNEEEFQTGNVDLTRDLIEELKKHNNYCPVILSSSIQAEQENPYGKSKREAENLLIKYSKEYETPLYIYRLPNVFGKWSKPNYNSVISTFCNNIARELPIAVSDNSIELNLVYIDDVINEFKEVIENRRKQGAIFYEIETTHRVKLGNIVELLNSFKSSRENLSIPDMSDDFTKKLYSTYLSYIPENDFGYDLKMNTDSRGSFTELIKTKDRGQVSINISKPGITKGNHWHHTKNEKFIVVGGRGIIRFRHINSEEVIEYHVSSEKMEVIDIPVGYTHNIENVSNQDLITVMWANEQFNPDIPDTYYEEV